MPIATYSVTVRPDVLETSDVCAFNANWTSVISEKDIGNFNLLVYKI